jgi:hypothetical protein
MYIMIGGEPLTAGDVRHGSVKRVASSVGEGAMATALVHTYLRELERRRPHARRYTP